MAAGAATWVDPPPAKKSPVEVAPRSAIALTPPLQSQGAPQYRSDTPQSGIEVTEWTFGNNLESAQRQAPQGNVAPGRPLYLWMTLNGTQPAIDRMRADGTLTIEVRWMRETGEAAAGAPNLVTALTIGRPGVVDTLEQQVRRKGFFEWHSWARKDMLGRGTWTVSLTSPDGQALLCGRDAQPCRFTINVG